MERDVLKRSMVGWVKDARKLTWHASSPTRGRVTDCRTPQPCLLLGMSLKWFHKWPDQASDPAATNSLFTTMDRRRNTIEPAVKVILGKKHGLHGSPRLHAAPSMTTGPRQTRRSRIRCAVECWWRGGSSAGTGSPGRTRPVPKLIDSPHRDLTTDRPDTPPGQRYDRGPSHWWKALRRDRQRPYTPEVSSGRRPARIPTSSCRAR